MGLTPQVIQIYHIVHVDRLPSILQHNGLFSDAQIIKMPSSGTTIGLGNIKQRRLTLPLSSYPNLYVGSCVPFYFCPRSIMLFLIHKHNKELPYQGGQGQIIHLVADFYETVNWANTNNLRWAFTSSNAGSCYFTDYNDLQRLNEIDWDAVNATSWAANKYGKQAEFLLEQYFPWFLVKEIGVYSNNVEHQVALALTNSSYKPITKVIPEWYY
jgi:hypothetical protein